MNTHNRLRQQQQQQLKIEMQRDQNNPENNIVYLNFDLLGPEKLVKKTAQPASCKPPIVIARQNSY